MKKILSIFVLCFAMICANAQVPIFHEGFDEGVLPTGWTVVDQDGDGYNWDAEIPYENEFETVAGAGCIASASYINGVGALTPNNYLISPAITLTANATLHFYVKGLDANYSDEHYSVWISTTGASVADFTTMLTQGTTTSAYVEHTCDLSAYTGQTVYIAFRHHDITDMYFILLDEVSVQVAPTEPTIVATSELDFGTVLLGGNSVKTTQVNAYLLTSPIAASVSDPFTVSADGTTYGATATLPTNGGTLYVKYAPTSVVSSIGTLSLTSGNATATITVSGEGFECTSLELPYYTIFDDPAENSCWSVVDIHGDGDANGQGQFNLDPQNGIAIYYVSTDTTHPANDWLISPEFTLDEHTLLSFSYMNYFDAMYYLFYGMTFPERFSVSVIPADTNYTGAIEVLPAQDVETMGQWAAAQIDLSAFANQAVRIGIKVETDPTHGYYLAISGFSLNADPTMVLSTNEIDFGTGIAGTTSAVYPVEVATLNMEGPLSINSTTPYTVSVDGTTFATTATLVLDTTMMTSDTIYVKYEPTVAGTFNDVISFVYDTDLTDTINVLGAAVECTAIDEFPFAESFDATSETASCWQIIDANADGKTFAIGNGVAVYTYSSANAANDWLISPELVLTGNQLLSFDAYCYSSSYPEQFEVAIIDENGTQTIIMSSETISSTNPISYTLDLTSYTGTYTIGFHCTSDANMWNLYFANVLVQDAVAAITIEPNTLDFTAAVGSVSDAIEALLTTVAITEPVTISVPAPFEISIDGINYDTTLTVTPAGIYEVNDIYVRFAPEAAGNVAGTLIATDGNLSVTAALTGVGVNCSNQTLPYETDFSDETKNACWTIIDANGDGESYYGQISIINEDDYSYLMYGYSEVNNADDWAISPAFTLGENAAASFEYAVRDASYPEKYSVYVIGEGQTIATATQVLNTQTVTSTNWAFQAVNLSAFNGQTVQIGIHVESDADDYVLYITNFRVANGAVGIEEVSAENNDNVNIYPNPANDVLNVAATSNINSVEVYTIAGQKVAGFTANGMQTAINTANLSNGMYIVKIHTENGVVNQKFTVVR